MSTYQPELHDPLFNELKDPSTILSPDRSYILYSLLKQCSQLEGEIWECGVYKGGSAKLMANYLNMKPNPRTLVLFDTFEGMPEAKPEIDFHKRGDFSDTQFHEVKAKVNFPFVQVVKGWIPSTFLGREKTMISMAHVDVDIYQSVKDCCEFIYPRLCAGGVIIFDDYGFDTCKGAKLAVDEYFMDKRSVPLVLPTGQAIVFGV